MSKIECKNGHPLSGDNLYINPSGFRNCRICQKLRQSQWIERNREKYLEQHRIRAAKYRSNPDGAEKQKLAKKRWNKTEKAKTSAKLRVDMWRENNREKFNEQRRGHYERNRERIAAYLRARWRDNNPGPAIRRIARELAAGRIDIATAVEQIRQHTARIDAEVSKRTGRGV